MGWGGGGWGMGGGKGWWLRDRVPEEGLGGWEGWTGKHQEGGGGKGGGERGREGLQAAWGRARGWGLTVRGCGEVGGRKGGCTWGSLGERGEW